MNETTVQHADSHDTAKILRMISNPKRWAIIQYLHSASLATATVIQRRCQIKQPTVSKHLKLLTDANLLTKENVGTMVVYRINGESLESIRQQIPKV